VKLMADSHRPHFCESRNGPSRMKFTTAIWNSGLLFRGMLRCHETYALTFRNGISFGHKPIKRSVFRRFVRPYGTRPLIFLFPNNNRLTNWLAGRETRGKGIYEPLYARRDPCNISNPLKRSLGCYSSDLSELIYWNM